MPFLFLAHSEDICAAVGKWSKSSHSSCSSLSVCYVQNLYMHYHSLVGVLPGILRHFVIEEIETYARGAYVSCEDLESVRGMRWWEWMSHAPHRGLTQGSECKVTPPSDTAGVHPLCIPTGGIVELCLSHLARQGQGRSCSSCATYLPSTEQVLDRHLGCEGMRMRDTRGG